MAKPVIQLVVSEEEFAFLTGKARNKRMTIQTYVKSRILDDTDFIQSYKEMVNRVEKLKSGSVFNVKALLGTDWVNLGKGTRLSLGKAFLTYVEANPGTCEVLLMDKDGSGTQWYKKA
ncbi:MAG: single-stranded DNA-binding protein [Erysipelotrichaceae bacterium]|jgi:hypothetical protein